MIQFIALSGLTIALASVFIWQGPGSRLAAAERRILLRTREIFRDMNYGTRRSFELLTSFPEETDEQPAELELTRR